MEPRPESSEEIPVPGPMDTGRGRRRVATVLAVVIGLAYAFPFFGFIGLVAGWFEGGDRLIHRVHDLGNGILFGILVAVPFLLLSRALERKPALIQALILSGAAEVIGGALAADPLLLAFGVGQWGFVLLVLVVSPVRLALIRRDRSFSPVLAVLALAGTVPLVAYAVTTAELQRLGPATDPHVEMHHWSTMAAMALAIALVGLRVALLAASRTPGWRIVAWCVGLAAATYGLASTVFPTAPGAEGRGWGAVALVGGLAYVAVAEIAARRERRAGGS